MAEIVITRSQSGSTVTASAGDVLSLRLPENPTTGYRWQIDSMNLLVPLEDTYSPSSAAPGSAGERVFRFTVSAGTGHVRVVLRRAWESGAGQDDFELFVQLHR